MSRALLLCALAGLAGCVRNSSLSAHETGASDSRQADRARSDRSPEGAKPAEARVDGACGASACEIDGACVPSGQADSASSCRVCDPSFSRRTWAPAPGCVITLAGSVQGFADGPAGSARFNLPEDILVEGPGKVLVADADNNRIRRIEDGVVTTVAGDGTPGYADGPAGSAMFYYPHGLAMAVTGQIFVADLEGHRVRAIGAGAVTTVAGDGVEGHVDGPAATARFIGPLGLALHAGKLYVADETTVRIVEAGAVSTLAGDGTAGFVNGPAAAARFNEAYGVAVTSAGRVYVTDAYNHAIRVVFGGLVTTLCGDGQLGYADGPASTAKLGLPEGIAFDGSGAIIFTEHGAAAVRRVADNVVSTIAGSSPFGLADGPISAAKFRDPTGVGLDSAGRVYVGDTANHRVRVFRLQ